MSEALKTKYLSNLEQREVYNFDGPLRASVGRALQLHLGDDAGQVILQENVDKYQGDEVGAAKDLTEVFNIMKQLNAEGLSNPGLGRLEPNSKNFGQALDESLKDVAQRCEGRPLTYVELGPEPSKTSHILKRLRALGIDIASYTGVDINPTSETEMRSVLQDTLPNDKINYQTVPFESFNTQSLQGENTQVLVTMLGFQEGNEDPATIADWFKSMMTPGDLLLSEMQLYAEDRHADIQTLYHHPSMRRFSKIALTRALGNLFSDYHSYLVPVELADGHQMQAMILCEQLKDRDDHVTFVTNYCLKYSKEEFRRYRELSGAFNVVSETYTGDETIVFQLSQRVGD
ncbi:hypothetical protein ROA7450_02109 [Roseovarius albus]|uniref:Histidine-specific methyltransferase SAM-dependent domain-containing protein n=1 Tax=Roseovarius albus TaxID=1247867 RepID=A0A1X6Z7P1_9RHOB|nr:L-histidine N(alpha)-methyltransferase [Roseovarius albus]SLN43011.1 hypothetical protein ROA7450_02109 [Roseovarius albus]